MQISSPAFEHNESIPSLYTCDGENINPALVISEVPGGAKSLALLMDDPDIPDFVKEKMGIEKYDHWTVFNLPPETTELAENTPPPGIQGVNSSGQNSYTGPCPPDREHRYFFKLFALDTTLDLPEGAAQTQVEQAMEGHILEQAELVGLYERQ